MTKPCILGISCPNKTAKRNKESESNCVFCGKMTPRKGKKTQMSMQMWSNKPNKKVIEIDSLSDLKKSQKKYDDPELKCDYFLSQLSIFKPPPLKSDDEVEKELCVSPIFLDTPSTSSAADFSNFSYFNSPSTSSTIRSKYKNFHNLPTFKLERLIFKSFKLQFDNCYSSSSEDESNEQSEEPAPKKRRKGSKKRRSLKSKPSVPIGSGFYKFRPARRHDFNQMPGMPSDSETDLDETSHFDHDYSTSEMSQITESNAENLAYETENMNWDCEIIDNMSHNSSVTIINNITNNYQSPQMYDSVIDTGSSKRKSNKTSQSDRRAPFDHDVYCVNAEKKEIITMDISGSAPFGEEIEIPKGANQSPEAKSSSASAKESNSSKRWECPICLEMACGQDIATTLCGHVFCKDCIESYLLTCDTCPSCRTNVSNQKLIPLYNFG